MEFDLNILNEEDLNKAGILDLNEVNINGILDNEYNLHLNIQGKMILPCNLTLEPVDYPFDITLDENITELIKNSKKTQKTIDILPIIWENILMEIPMKIVSPKAKNMKTKGEGWELITDSKSKANNGLAKLKDLL